MSFDKSLPYVRMGGSFLIGWTTQSFAECLVLWSIFYVMTLCMEALTNYNQKCYK